MDTFWVVWQPNTGNPTVRHASEMEAQREAHRLAEFNPGREFYVLQALTVSRKVSVVTERLDESIALPF